MNIKPLKIGELQAKIPLIQGGMGVGISLGNLAGVVANEGGVGIISTAQIGFKEKDFYVNTLAANLRALEKELKKARKIAPKGILGFNIMTALTNYKEQVLAAVKAGADIIISGAGLPVDLPAFVQGYKTKIAPIVSGKKSAQVILKYWDTRYKKTADLVVIEGPKAGGHLGFKKDELEKYGFGACKRNDMEKYGFSAGKKEENCGLKISEDNQNDKFEQKSIKDYKEEVLEIKKVVQEYENKYSKKIPIVLAGGITTRDDVKNAFDLGMDGVQVGSLFVTTEECDAHINYKNSYVNAKEDEITIVKSPVGMPGRAIKNKFMSQVMAGENFPPKKCLKCLKKCNPANIPYCITERLINAAEGNVDNGLLFCGANAYMQNEITTVHRVIEKLFG